MKISTHPFKIKSKEASPTVSQKKTSRSSSAFGLLFSTRWRTSSLTQPSGRAPNMLTCNGSAHSQRSKILSWSSSWSPKKDRGSTNSITSSMTPSTKKRSSGEPAYRWFTMSWMATMVHTLSTGKPEQARHTPWEYSTILTCTVRELFHSQWIAFSKYSRSKKKLERCLSGKFIWVFTRSIRTRFKISWIHTKERICKSEKKTTEKYSWRTLLKCPSTPWNKLST